MNDNRHIKNVDGREDRPAMGGLTADLFSAWIPRISKIAGKYAVSDLPFEDIVAEGNLGLTEALMAGVTEEKEIRASIENQIERFIAEMRSERDADDRLTAQVVLLSETIDRWNSEHGEKPTVDELANKLGVSQDKILDILKLTGEVPEDEK